MDNLLDLTSRVEATHFWFRGFRRFVAPALGEIAGSRRDLVLLDCGCGTGHNLATLLRPYGRAFGFDVTPGGLLRARAAGLPVARANMSAMPFESSRFDVVTSFDVMQYVEDDYAAMKEMARVLKPGGGLVVTAAALNVLRGGHAGTWPEVRRYTGVRMRSIVEGADMKVERLTYLFATLFPAMLAVRALNRSTPSSDWEMRVPAAPINAALSWMLSGEAAISRRIPMPAGSSVLLVARKI
jgi:ubiquinone/menaquinone biosynthesis C-methylase UbiE